MFPQAAVLRIVVFLALSALVSACGTSRKGIMFKTGEGTAAVQQALTTAEKSYIVRPNDLLDVRVFTNKGEVLIDPTNELKGGDTRISANIPGFVQGGGGGGGGAASGTASGNVFRVSPEGTVNLPMVGWVRVDGLTISQADSALQKVYNTYYEDSYVVTKLLSKRVYLLGAFGGKVIPLEHPDMNLVEVLAVAGASAGGGIANVPIGNATNIRLLRGDLQNPIVSVVDLSTIQGLTAQNLTLQHGDIIYVEPVRRIVSETIQEYGPLLSVFVQVLTLYVFFTTRR